MEVSAFYGGKDPREIPFYSVREGARFIRISPSTLSDWVQNRWKVPGTVAQFAGPLIRTPEQGGGRLSFNNLVEAFVLNSLRKSKGFSMNKVRIALYSAKEYRGVDRPFLSKKLTAAGDLFWDEISSLHNLSRVNQLAFREILEAHLDRIDWDEETGLPKRLHPFVASFRASDSIVIDPRVCFGQPFVKGYGVTTTAIIERLNAGESIEEVCDDYEMQPGLIEDVLLYETSKN